MADYPFGTVEIGATATFLCRVASVYTQAIIKNRGPGTIYLGGSTVTADATSTGGYPLSPGEQVMLPTCNPATDPGLDIYAIVATGDAAYLSWIAV